MRIRQVVIGNALISYREERAGSGMLVFLHGWRSEGAAWLPMLGALGPRPETIVVPDLPGFGVSGIPERALSLGEYADIVKGLIIKECPDGKTTIVGHSFGARVAAKIAAEQPPFLGKLVLVASGGARPRQGLRMLKWLAAKLVKPFFMPRFMHGAKNAIYRAMGTEDYVVRPELKSTFLNVIGEDIRAFLPEITAETLIVWGDKDDTAPLAYGETMARLIPRAKLAVMRGAGHWCFRERPEEFTRILREFLDGK